MEGRITNIDFKTRMQYISCCLGNKASKLIKDLQLGKDCKKEQKVFYFANAVFELLKCWDPTITGVQTVTSLNLTEITNIPTLYQIIENEQLTSLEITINGDTAAIVEDGEYTVNLESINAELEVTFVNTSIYIEEGTNDVIMLFDCMYGGNAITFDAKGREIPGAEFTVTIPPCEIGEATIADNCLLHEDMLIQLNWLAEYCDICFPEDLNYYEFLEQQ